MMDVSIRVSIIPFPVPDEVQLNVMVKDDIHRIGSVALVGPGLQRRASIPINQLDKDTIDGLVEQFRQGLYEKMDKEDNLSILTRNLAKK